MIYRVVLVCLLSFGLFPVFAQNRKKTDAHHTEALKKKDTVFISTLGDVPGRQSLPASFAKGLLNAPLIVHDQEHQVFRVVSFSFGYQTYGTYNNDTTGMPEKTSSYISYPFYSNRIDSLWRARIGNELKPGDQLYFDHIVAEGKNGTYHLSSPLHFTIK